MSTASDFLIVPLGPEDLLHYDLQFARGYCLCLGAPNCRERIRYAASYTYPSSKTTGRRTMSMPRRLAQARAWSKQKCRVDELPQFTEAPEFELKGPANAQPSSETNAKKNQGGEYGN